ncbi:HET-domain-containing protein, partial [Zopfia rhizophila CBS 207.26]
MLSFPILGERMAKRSPFKDLVEGTGKSKVGYGKIRFCGRQAANDGLQYFWVDTCCIDKSSSAELSEAINSMFRWYHDAAKCYVYLSDVSVYGSVEKDQVSQWRWKPVFRKSRWFTRGWTLQELIAPASVEFFSMEGERLGDKRSMEQSIHEITGVNVQALQGSPLYYFSVDERMLWAVRRETKREEDAAYSLLGIFDIHMPLIYGEGRKKALKRLKNKIKKSLEDKPPALPPALSSKHEDAFKCQEAEDAPWIVPFDRNPHFTGRELQLAKLREMLSVGRGQTTKVAVMGLGGVGKTQLVLELVYQIREEHKNCSIIWIPATNIESLHQAYVDVARQLSIPGWERDNANLKRHVQGYLSKESSGRWVLVFDNADNIDMWMAKPESEPGSGRLIEFLPRSKQGSIIFTTRDRKAAVKLAHWNMVEVPEMKKEVAKELLQKYLLNLELTKYPQDTEALLAELTYLPLAIVQATAYINENRITLADYLYLLADQEEGVIDLLSEEFADDGRYHNVKNPVATTWLISFEQIRHRDPLAADYLSFMACIDPKDIPQSILPAGASRKKEMDAIGTLSAYSFVGRRSADQCLDLHRLVHLATRNWLRTEGKLTKWAAKAVARLNEVFPDADHKNRNIWRAYLHHARYVFESCVFKVEAVDNGALLWKFGMCVHSDGRYSEAEKTFSQVVGIRKRVLGAEHPDTLTSIGRVAWTLSNQGRWKEAEELEVQVMETRKRVLGSEHPDTLTSMANLASTYRNQGRWKEAEELEVQVMETRKRVLGSEHPSTLSSMANLASTYSNQGRWKDAEELQAKVLQICSRVLGSEHPDKLRSMANLASTYSNQGRWKEAEELEVQVMETRKR